MGSDSDFPVVRKAAEALKEFGIPFEMRVLSAHRSPKEVAEFAQSARTNGFVVIIAAAGMAAHLAGAIAGNTTLPVIAIPVKAKALEGVDALLSSVMMPPGVPAVSDDSIAEKLLAFKKKQNEKNLAADAKMQETAKEI